MDESLAKADKISLEDLYLEKGFWNSQVNYQILESEDDQSTVILRFDLVENDSRKIRKISFAGNSQLKDSELLDVMETAPWRFWRFWSKRSKYQPRILEEDLEQISQVYRNKGFLDVRINQGKIKISEIGKNRIDLQIEIHEGTRSFFGKQKIFGQAVMDEETLMQDTLLKRGEPYSTSLIIKGKK